jgi:hypothetical protein
LLEKTDVGTVPIVTVVVVDRARGIGCRDCGQLPRTRVRVYEDK